MDKYDEGRRRTSAARTPSWNSGWKATLRVSFSSACSAARRLTHATAVTSPSIDRSGVARIGAAGVFTPRP